MGVGSRLVHEAIDRAKVKGWEAIFVLGSPNCYERFGFDVAAAKGFSSPYGGGHFMILRLSGALTASGQLTHAPAFAALD
jgi:putative acetyltransferase